MVRSLIIYSGSEPNNLPTEPVSYNPLINIGNIVIPIPSAQSGLYPLLVE